MTTRAVITAGFAAIILTMVVVDAAGRRGVGRARAPLGDALTAALRTTAGRAVVLAVWLWLGWHFLAR
ncbi:hypothetical protein EV384_2167 [Micromonospora kangleipakensis]|uniref:Uncharacterized protein n=1 Tax=Micromonospora kangleipakensis TaxID=1077942 RepID=A0A4Q8B7V0_9ACTN|nr:DUF6186 family protein [Micromonospora kangleipakensis]RZU73747.1 hypothetical protein EV384_2167 [Micromonospora kangleipakensis]